MRRRLDLAVSLIGRPEVLFLDEPTTGLDPRHRNEVWDAVRGLTAQGATVLLTTQYLEEADQLADELVVLDRGGPIVRLQSDAPLPDFQFPQQENPQLAARDWRPELLDYLYVSCTNSIAFSPTDAMPLTRHAKALMALQSAASVVTVLVVAARAINVIA